MRMNLNEPECHILGEALGQLNRTYKGWLVLRNLTEAERQLVEMKIKMLDGMITKFNVALEAEKER